MKKANFELPEMYKALINQNGYESPSFTACFNEHGEVYDEKENHTLLQTYSPNS
jgi:hypothetical protein